MSEKGSSFDRECMKREGSQVREHVVSVLLDAKAVPTTDEFYADFLMAALSCWGDIIRADLLEQISDNLARGTLNEALLDKTIGTLCTLLDRHAFGLANQVDLLAELKNAPKVRQ